jgi:hypothetical protein
MSSHKKNCNKKTDIILIEMKQEVQRPALPIFVQPSTSIELSGLRVVLDDRGWPRAVIAEGTVPEDNNRLALYAATEFEEPMRLPSTKPGREWLHLTKIRDDLERHQIKDLSGKPRFGEDPPDFVLSDHDTVTVEMAQFTHRQRREALGLLRAVKQALLRQPSAEFKHLQNRLVLIGFEDQHGLPPKASNHTVIESVLERLRHTPSGPEPLTVPETVEPHGFSISLKNSPLGQGESACFPLPVLPHSELSKARGFDVAASLTLINGARDTEAELMRIIREHDIPGNGTLVISSGAPAGVDGFALISEEIAVEPARVQTLNLSKPKYLKRILLHRWSFGDVYELFPEYINIVKSTMDCSGPCVVPVGKPPDWAWNIECPCGNGKIFRQCHGI